MKPSTVLIIGLLFFIIPPGRSSQQFEKVSYQGFKLIKVRLNNEEQVKTMEQFLGESKDSVHLLSPGLHLNLPTQLLVHEKVTGNFKLLVASMKLETELVLEDMQKAIEKEEESLKHRRIFSVGQNPSSFTLDEYHRHTEINAYLKALHDKYPSITSLFRIGFSFEGREMFGIKVGNKMAAPHKKVYWINAGIHAREWIAPASSLLIISQLVTKYNSDPAIKHLVDSLDWYILPSANPDGYEYTWSTNRLWRKTRSFHPSVCKTPNCCKGVDPNRNWDFQFGGLGTSSDPCSDIYKGPYAFSEPETRAMSQMIMKLGANNNMGAFIALHSAAQLWLVPYGYAQNAFPSNYNQTFVAAVAAEAAERKVHNVKYIVENSAGLYPAAGASDDWTKARTNATYVYTIELRNSAGDFILPVNQIIPTGEEVFEGIKSIANRVIQGI